MIKHQIKGEFPGHLLRKFSVWLLNTVSYQFDEVVQGRRNSSALAMELHLSCINPMNKEFPNYKDQTVMRPFYDWYLYNQSHYTWKQYRVNIYEVLLETQERNFYAEMGPCWDHPVYVPSQWEMALHCNTISHWLDTYTGWSLDMCHLLAVHADKQTGAIKRIPSSF